MKRNYQLRNNKRTLVLLGIVLLVGVLVLTFGVGQKPLANLFSPLIKFSHNLKEGGGNLVTFFSDKSDLKEKIERLERENTKLKLDSRNWDLIQKENQELKEGWGREDEDGDPPLLARVISKPPVSPFDILTIDIGSNHGIEKGERVLVAENTEIGFVSTVFNDHSIVTLYSNAGERTPVEINSGGSLVIAEGEGGGAFTIQAPRTLTIERGDAISRPSLESRVIGTVESSETEETDSFVTVHARLPINIFEITWVYIQTSPK